MYYVRGLDIAQIAALLGGASEACIKSKLRRGRQLVKMYAADFRNRRAC